MAQHADPLEIVQRFAEGDTSPEVLNHLRLAVGVYLRIGGIVPLERCLRLPTTPSGLRLALRNLWLLRAAEQIEETTAYSAGHALAKELSTFIMDGPWRLWRYRNLPPDEAGALRSALFHAAHFNGGRVLSAKQVGRVIGRRFSKKCPTNPSRLHLTPKHTDDPAPSCTTQRSQQR